MTEILYAPDQERVATTNAWAFLHWLRVVHQVTLKGWAELQQFSAKRPADFTDAVAAFARLPARLRQPDALLSAGNATRWPDLLLHADIRPDDRLLVSGSAVHWLAARTMGAAVIFATSTDLWTDAARERATVVAAPAGVLARASFRHPAGRQDLGELRSVIAGGGPLSPEARRRIYAWVRSDLMLLASSGDIYWGNPLEPVLTRPPAAPAFFRPPLTGAARP